MTAKVIQFKSKEDRKPRTKKQPPDIFAKTDNDIYRDTLEDVLGEWQAAAARDQINEYIASKLPSSVKMKDDMDYINNLNALSMIEQKLKMRLGIFYPGCTTANKIGWIAAFHIGKVAYTTPPDMASEGYARAICIVLFVTFEKHMKSLGRKINA
jgi:hypothetical protein